MSKPVTVSLSHNLTPAEVKRRIVAGIAEARAKHPHVLKDSREIWASDNQMDFTARAILQTVTGSVRIEPNVVHISVNLPMLLVMFAEKLKPQLESEGRKMLEKK